MVKEYITPTNIAFFLWGLILLVLSGFYPDYTRYYLYLSIVVIIPVVIFSMIKQRREDKIKGTKEFQSSLYRMLFVAFVMIVFYFITKQNYS